MGNVITNLKAKFGVDTSDFKKGLKDGERAVSDFKGVAGSQIEELAGMFGVNMSAVNDAIGTAGRSLNFVGQSFKGAAAGGNIFKIALTGVKLALVSTGIGAIIVALGSLIAYFQKSGKGADQFARILAQVKSVINNVIDRLAIFGKGVYEIATGKFKQGWEDMKGAFKGIGEEIKNDWTASGILADRLDALDDKEIKLITSLEERRAKAAELRRQAKEETEDQRKKLALIEEAEKITKSVYADQVSVEKERLSIMKEQLQISAQDPTDEQRREIAEQEAKINTLLTNQSNELRGILREKNATIEANKKLEAQFGYYKNIKAPQLLNKETYAEIDRSLKKLQHTFIQTKDAGSALYDVLGLVWMDLSNTLNQAFESMAVGIGEFVGAFAAGTAGLKDINAVIFGTLADLAITVGKIAIGAGLAVLGIKQALMTLNPFVAIVAGTALIALGSVVKGALSKAASGGGSAASISSSGSTSLASSVVPRSQNMTITLQGKLVAEGRTLAWVIEQENLRKKVST